MKKILSLILAVICLFMLVACGNEADDNKVRVFTFYGENEYVSVTNGTVVLNGDNEVFSGGILEVLKEAAFVDAVYWSAEFYITKDGEKKTVYITAVEDLSESAKVNISGDLGKISGGSVIDDYTDESAEELINNLFMIFNVRYADGEEASYEIHMKVEEVC